MHGSIVWHLAVASVLNNTVLMGPSQDVFSEGSFLSSADGYLWDDTLSEDDLEVICGVYKVYTGMFFASFHFMHTYKSPSLCQAKPHNRPTCLGGQSRLLGVTAGCRWASGVLTVRNGFSVALNLLSPAKPSQGLAGSGIRH